MVGKSRLILILYVLFMNHASFAHKEWVHQHIVKEAYRYLENEKGQITDLKNHIGLDYYGYGDDADPWGTGLIVVAAYREDKEDPIWGYGGLFNRWTPSATHLWNADHGDETLTPITASPDAYNAWQKARIYLFGGHRIFFAKTAFAADIGQTILGRFYSYSSLIDFFKTGHCYADGYMDLAANIIYYPIPHEIYMQIDQAQKYAYQILGRVAHLLTDMSVPAHSHADEHPCILGDPDYYELYMGGNATGNCNESHTQFPALGWNATTAASQGTMLDVLGMIDYDAMRFLFYTQNQLADFFPSDDVPQGDNNLPNGSNPYLLSRYSILGTPPKAIVDPVSISNESFNFAIRATATLFFWFAKSTGLWTSPPFTASIVGPEYLNQNSSALYSVSVSNGSGIYDYQWYQDNLKLGKNPTQSITMGSAQFRLQVQVWDKITGIAIHPQLYVKPYPPLSATISGANYIYEGNSATYTVNVTGGSGSRIYQWYFINNGGNSWQTVGTNSNQTVSMGAVGFILRVDVKDNFTGETMMLTKDILRYPTLGVTITTVFSGPNTTYTANPTGGAGGYNGYSWQIRYFTPPKGGQVVGTWGNWAVQTQYNGSASMTLITSSYRQVKVSVKDGNNVSTTGLGGYLGDDLPKIPVGKIPSQFDLLKNYPNPFNPTTTIRYALPQAGTVHLEIFNLIGQKIRTLVNEYKTEGFYEVVWNGLNDTGNPIASGEYFYKIEITNENQLLFQRLQKMILLK